jgi:hypothetical protein
MVEFRTGRGHELRRGAEARWVSLGGHDGDDVLFRYLFEFLWTCFVDAPTKALCVICWIIDG